MAKSNLSRLIGAKKIYLDHASSAIFLDANPGAIHEFGLREKNKLEQARKDIASILGAQKNEIFFTSGATESNNLGILGLAYPYLASPYIRGRKKEGVVLPHIVTTNIEHASVLEVCKHLEKTKMAEVTYIEVEENGIVDIRKIKKALKKNTILVSVMYANNEIGAIQPIREIAREIRHFKNLTRPKKIGHPLLNKERVGERCIYPFFHTDATQAINYLPVNVERLGVDLMSWNSSKIYGPKGVGALYVRKNTPIQKIMFGGDQEFGLRPGTENVALARGLASAMQAVEKIKNKEVERLKKLQEYFIKKLKNIDSQLILNGDLEQRLPNNINITIPNIPSDLLVIELSARGVMAAAKSACKSGDGKASHVIEAINKNIKETDGSLRLSMGRDTTKQDLDYTIKALKQILTKLKKWY